MGGLAGVLFFGVALGLLVQLVAIGPWTMVEDRLLLKSMLDGLYEERLEEKPRLRLYQPDLYVSDANKVKRIVFNVSNLGEESIRADQLRLVSIILEYEVKLGGTRERPLLSRYSTWVPFDPIGPAGKTCWTIVETYDDKFEPLSVQSMSGAWNRGETVKVKVEFSLEDEPYWDGDKGFGHFYIIISPPLGELGALAVKDAEEVAA